MKFYATSCKIASQHLNTSGNKQAWNTRTVWKARSSTHNLQLIDSDQDEAHGNWRCADLNTASVADSLHLAKPGGCCGAGLWLFILTCLLQGVVLEAVTRAWSPRRGGRRWSGGHGRAAHEILQSDHFPIWGHGAFGNLSNYTEKSCIKTNDERKYSRQETENKKKISMINKKATSHGMIIEMRALLPPDRKISHGVFLNLKEILMCGW